MWSREGARAACVWHGRPRGVPAREECGPICWSFCAIAHLVPRRTRFTLCYGCHHMAFAIHKFFNDKGFYYLHTPHNEFGRWRARLQCSVSLRCRRQTPADRGGRADWSQDFWQDDQSYCPLPAGGELGTLALGEIYTLPPAENSNTPRHLAEFWMEQPEMAFYGHPRQHAPAEAERCSSTLRGTRWRTARRIW